VRVRSVINKLHPEEQFSEQRFYANAFHYRRFSNVQRDYSENYPPSMSIANFLSLLICLSRDGSKDTLVFPFDAKNDSVVWLEDVVNSALIISCFWRFQATVSDEGDHSTAGMTNLLRGAFNFEGLDKRLQLFHRQAVK